MTTLLLTPVQIAALPLPTLDQIPAAILARLDALSRSSFASGWEFYGGTLVAGLFGLFYGEADAERIQAAQDVLAAFGYVAPTQVSAADVAAAMDAIRTTDEADGDGERRTLYGVALALQAGHPGAAVTMLDGAEGAGIGWVLTREELAPVIPTEVPGGARLARLDPRVTAYLARFRMIAYTGVGALPWPTDYGMPMRVAVTDDGGITVLLDDAIDADFIQSMHAAAVAGNPLGHNDVRTTVSPAGLTIWPGQQEVARP